MVARKSKYDTHIKPHLSLISDWVRNGEYEYNIAKKLGIHIDTLEEYKKKHSEFSEALINGQQNLLLDLRSALYKKAKGFEYVETKREVKKGDQAYKKVTRTKKVVLPDTAALTFALTNLDKKNWKRENETVLNADDMNITVNLIDGKDDEE